MGDQETRFGWEVRWRGDGQQAVRVPAQIVMAGGQGEPCTLKLWGK